jgi:hypothetical protein
VSRAERAKIRSVTDGVFRGSWEIYLRYKEENDCSQLKKIRIRHRGDPQMGFSAPA